MNKTHFLSCNTFPTNTEYVTIVPIRNHKYLQIHENMLMKNNVNSLFSVSMVTDVT